MAGLQGRRLARTLHCSHGRSPALGVAPWGHLRARPLPDCPSACVTCRVPAHCVARSGCLEMLSDGMNGGTVMTRWGVGQEETAGRLFLDIGGMRLSSAARRPKSWSREFDHFAQSKNFVIWGH